MTDGKGDRCEPIPQEVTDGKGDKCDRCCRQEGVSDAAVGKAVFNEAADGKENFADGAGGSVNVR